MLTPAQLTTLKTAINNTPEWAAYPNSGDGWFDLARKLNETASPNFWVWSTNADVAAVRAAIVGANLTPTDAPDGTQQWMNRSLQCQGKQLSLQLFLPFSGTLNASDANLRTTLQDALQGVRSGAGGASQDAGWTAVRNTLARLATSAEKILADTGTGDGSTRANSANLVFQGSLSTEYIRLARVA
jgi:hypothetical protein